MGRRDVFSPPFSLCGFGGVLSIRRRVSFIRSSSSPLIADLGSFMDDYRVTLRAGSFTRDYLFVGGPIDNADEEISSIFEAIGFIAASWSRLEQHIDAIILQINDPAHSAELYDEQHPVSFKPKLKFIKKWFNQSTLLAEHKESMRDITSELKTLSVRRDELVHSSLQSFNKETMEGYFESIRFDRAETSFKIYSFSANIDYLVGLAVSINRSNLKIMNISRLLFTQDGVEKFRIP